MIELIVSVIIIAIVMYAALLIYISSGARGVNVDVFASAQSLAEGKLEEVMARPFNSISAEAQANYAGDLSAYSHEVVIDFVSQSDLNTPVYINTDYKKIRVLIRHPKLANPTILECIRASYR